jgi:hypothetical protein
MMSGTIAKPNINATAPESFLVNRLKTLLRKTFLTHSCIFAHPFPTPTHDNAARHCQHFPIKEFVRMIFWEKNRRAINVKDNTP